MDVSPETLLGLIDQIYAAAADPRGWALVLESLQRATDATAAGLFVQDLPARSGTLLHQVGGDSKYVSLYHQRYAALNPWFRRACGIHSGDVRVGLAAELLQSEYYEDFWRPQGFADTLTAYAQSCTEEVAGIVVTRPVGHRAFSEADIALFRGLASHLQRAFDLQARIAELRWLDLALVQALDRLPQGAIVVDVRGRVLLANHSAQSLLDRCDGLALRDGRLSVAGSRREFQRRLEEALGSGSREAAGSSAPLKVARERGPDLELSIASIGIVGTAPGARVPAAIVFVGDGGGLSVDAGALAALFELTPAEGRVAAELATGRSLGETTQKLAITANTARTHLKRIFEKTGTHRQAALVLLLARSVASLPRPRLGASFK